MEKENLAFNGNKVCPHCHLVIAEYDPERTLINSVPMHGRCARAVRRNALVAAQQLYQKTLATEVLQ